MSQVNHPLQQIITSFEQTDQNLSMEKVPRRVILLMGQTKAGKTTLLYYLLGKKLNVEKNDIDVFQMVPQSKFIYAQIGNGYDSTTVYPNIPPFEGEEQAMIIDMPGFDDTRPHYRLLNIYILIETLKLLSEVHVCHVIPEQSLYGDELFRQFEKICLIFNTNMLLSPNSLSFFLTKIEDEQMAKQQFLTQINDISQQQMATDFKVELKQFASKNIYLFPNKQPIISKGEQLKRTIIGENNFYPINKHPHNLLSQQYCSFMIGTTNTEEFYQYVLEILGYMRKILPNIIQLFKYVMQMEFQSIIAYCLGTDLESFRTELSIKIAEIQQFIYLEDIDKMTIQMKEWSGMNANRFVCLLKCYKKIDESQDEFQYFPDTLLHFSLMVSLIKQKAVFKNDFLDRLQLIFKSLSSLIIAIREITYSKIKQNIEMILKDEYIIESIASHYQFWDKYQNIILKSPEFNSISKEGQIQQLMSVLKIHLSGQHEVEVIQKVSVLRQISDKKLLNLIAEAKLKGIQRQYPQKNEKIDEMKDIQLKNINILNNSSSTLQYLIKNIHNLKEQPVQNITLLRTILQKISYVFYCFSYFQEAICCNLALQEQGNIQLLLAFGMEAHQISKGFVLEILIPYYEKVRTSSNQLKRLYNYLLSITLSSTEIFQYQLVLVQKLANISSTDQEISQDKEFEPYYVDVILSNSTYYLQQIKKREVLFNKSILNELKGSILKHLKH